MGKLKAKLSVTKDLLNKERMGALVAEDKLAQTEANTQAKQDGVHDSNKTLNRRSQQRKQAYVQSESMEEKNGGKRTKTAEKSNNV